MTDKKTKSSNKKVDNAFVVSRYYGFEGLNIDQIEKTHHEKAKKMIKKENFKHENLPHLEEYVSVLSHSHKEEIKNPPALYYTKGEIKTSKRKKSPSKNIGLHIIGTPKSIAEAILIKTAFSILKEEGYKDIELEVNSLGGRESQEKFNKALTGYFRNKLDDLNSQCKEILKFGGHTLMACNPKGFSMEKFEDAPSSIEYLSEDSRKHFKEVIEYLESQEIPFEINKNVIGDPHYSTHTVFTILDKKTGKILATGTRYNDLAKKTITSKGHPAVSLNITLPKLKQVPSKKEPDFKKCDVYFIQLGYAAKLKSLEVIEILRKAGIHVHHAIGRDKMSTQTNFAHKKNVKYILVMGQKEAIENSVCVRDLETNSQTTVRLDRLVDHLKSLREKNKKK